MVLIRARQTGKTTLAEEIGREDGRHYLTLDRPDSPEPAFSREERRPHIHVVSDKGEAKYWIEPVVDLTRSHGLTAVERRRMEGILKGRAEEVRDAGNHYFCG